MNGINWTSYEFQRAPRTLLCQFRRKDGFAHTGYAKDFQPEFNIAGLEWRLTGIARTELEGMPEETRQQVMPQNIAWSSLMLVSKPGDFDRGSLLGQLFD
jgi:hypothetical protein